MQASDDRKAPLIAELAGVQLEATVAEAKIEVAEAKIAVASAPSEQKAWAYAVLLVAEHGIASAQICFHPQLCFVHAVKIIGRFFFSFQKKKKDPPLWSVAGT